jgi:hypothetical protein
VCRATARFFSRAVLRVLGAAQKHAPGSPIIDGDPFTDMRDSAGFKDLKISVLSASAAIASVLADFDRGDGDHGAGTREQLTYSLVMERGQWRVDDIAYSRAHGSTNTLREPPAIERVK